MLFNSYVFVFIYLPACLLGYYLLSGKREKKWAKIWLIAMSLWFYGSFQPMYLLILSGSVVFNYGVFRRMGIGADKYGKAGRQGALVIGIIGNLGLLFYFKYFNFFIDNMNQISDSSLPFLKVLLPAGISFFTFQQISFIVDGYRNEITKCGFTDYALYVTYFPKLVEGPIVLPSEMLPEFEGIGEKRFDAERFMRGSCLFIFGMLKKVILADTFGRAVDYGYGNLNIMHGSDAALLVVFYALQLYFDFSGYCDMARGISRMLGIALPVNFNSPYKARNIIDFWKRWHITLNRFFTKYVYIPLGGNRAGRARMYRNLLIVFFLSGLWHGAGWNFILWGMLHGVLYVFTRIWQNRTAAGGSGKKNVLTCAGAAVCVLLTFTYVSAAWVYFRAESVAQANELLRLILSNDFVRINRNLAAFFNLDEFWYVLKVFHLDKWEFGHYILMFGMSVFSLLLVFFGRNAAQVAERMKPKAWSAVLMAGLLLWCVLTFSNVSVFLYFNF